MKMARGFDSTLALGIEGSVHLPVPAWLHLSHAGVEGLGLLLMMKMLMITDVACSGHGSRPFRDSGWMRFEVRYDSRMTCTAAAAAAAA
jgi:hypothetical protein